MAERLRQVIADQPVELPNGQRLAVSGSIGFAAYPLAPGAQWQRSLELADQYLYQAKGRGRNGWFGVSRLAACRKAASKKPWPAAKSCPWIP